MRKLKILCERGSSSYEAGLFSTAIWKQKGNIRRKPMEKHYIFKFNIRRVFHYKIAGNVASFIKPCKNFFLEHAEDGHKLFIHNYILFDLVFGGL